MAVLPRAKIVSLEQLACATSTRQTKKEKQPKSLLFSQRYKTTN